ncbi:MAG: prepilin-type N-terminal cleavage/methylation domain-containing protein [Armatimonadetes bacterium]|nr:prepilin-type N-terminal cleavage/methylation domain-containing protein [Armatimonadota bacterium]
MRGKHGFTIVEMLVATILLGVGIFATLGAISVAVQATGSADFYQKAAVLAQRHISQLETNPERLAPGEQSGDFGDEYVGYRWTQRIASSEFRSLYQVTIIIKQGVEDNPKRREFTTYLRYDATQETAEREERSQKKSSDGAKKSGGGGNAPRS